MIGELETQSLPVEECAEIGCALCGRLFVTSPQVELLYADRLPVGLVCPECMANPHHAAEAAHGRAREIRNLARQCKDAVPRDTWIQLLQIAHSRADYWDGVAGRIESARIGTSGLRTVPRRPLCL